METIECIKTRRSVREYAANTSIDETTIKELIFIASWTPSGKNLQPWNVKVVTDNQCLKRISKMIPSDKYFSDFSLNYANGFSPTLSAFGITGAIAVALFLIAFVRLKHINDK